MRSRISGSHCRCRPTLLSRSGGFLGGVFTSDSFLGRGVRCNRDQARNLLCPLGTQLVPSDRDVIKHEADIRGARVGLEATIRFTERLTLRTEAAYVFAGSFGHDDSHFLRTSTNDPNPENNQGPAPNIVSKSDRLRGVQIESELGWRLDPHWTLSTGVRYWQFSGGTSTVTFGAQLPESQQDRSMKDRNTLRRIGGFTGVSYRF